MRGCVSGVSGGSGGGGRERGSEKCKRRSLLHNYVQFEVKYAKWDRCETYDFSLGAGRCHLPDSCP